MPNQQSTGLFSQYAALIFIQNNCGIFVNQILLNILFIKWMKFNILQNVQRLWIMNFKYLRCHTLGTIMPDSSFLSHTYKFTATYGPATLIKSSIDFSGINAPVLVVKRIRASSILILNTFLPKIFKFNEFLGLNSNFVSSIKNRAMKYYTKQLTLFQKRNFRWPIQKKWVCLYGCIEYRLWIYFFSIFKMIFKHQITENRMLLPTELKSQLKNVWLCQLYWHVMSIYWQMQINLCIIDIKQ